MRDKTSIGFRWRNRFRAGLDCEVDIRVRDRWTKEERPLLAESLAQFQLGEASDGGHLLAYARQFGSGRGDEWLGEAVALFIGEENRHSRWLGEFLVAMGCELKRSHWLDGIFRVVRKPLGFGLMVGVLVCAEIVAVPYYEAVRRRTASLWLAGICSRILDDEARHLEFQAENLGAIWEGRHSVGVLRQLHRLFMLGTCCAVWLEHRGVLRAGGYGWRSFAGCCLELLHEVHMRALAAESAKWREGAFRPVR